MAKKDKGVLTGDPVTYQTPSPAGGVQMETFIPWTLVKRGVKRQVSTPLDAPQEFQIEAGAERRERDAARHTPLIRALGLAHYWQRLLEEDKYRTITEIAVAEGLDLGRASRIAQLAQLDPSIVDACVTGTAPSVTLESVCRRAIPARWDEQRERLACVISRRNNCPCRALGLAGTAPCRRSSRRSSLPAWA